MLNQLLQMMKELLFINHHCGLNLFKAYYIYGAFTPSQQLTFRVLNTLNQAITREISTLKIFSTFYQQVC